MERIKISTLGEFQFYVGDVNIASKFESSDKKILLLQYLLAHKGERVDIRKLSSVLGNSSDEAQNSSTLKALVSRLRKELESCGVVDAVLTDKSSYLWNPTLNESLDIGILEALYEQTIDADTLTPDIRAKFEEMLSLYKADIFDGYKIKEHIAEHVERYREMYLDAAKRYVALLTDSGDYDDVIRVCKTALKVSAEETPLNISLMQALVREGSEREAIPYFRHTVEHRREFTDRATAEEMMGIYRSVIKKGHGLLQAAMQIEQELNENRDDNGAYVCDYAVFREMFSLYSKNLARRGIDSYLALITLRVDENTVDPLTGVSAYMDALLNLAKAKLRSGDIACQMGMTQCMLLLPSVSSNAAAHLVLERLEAAFNAMNEFSSCTITHEIKRLGEESLAMGGQNQ